jgi:hypothetical protein
MVEEVGESERFVKGQRQDLNSGIEIYAGENSLQKKLNTGFYAAFLSF